MFKTWLMFFGVLVSVISVHGQGKFSGYMFGDYYYVLKNHDESTENSNGFWFRRIYFTYDHTINEEFSVRFRLELNSPGDFTSSSKLQPELKDGYLKWKKSNHAVILGISSTPTWGFVEEFWGYRAVEKTPADLYRFDSSRDFGVAVQGSSTNKKLNYHFMIGNGSSNSSETNKGKRLRLALGYELAPGFTVEAYGDWEERPGNTNRYIAQGFAGYENSNFRIGAQLLHQTRKSDTGDLKLDVFSLIGATKFSEKVWGFARWDRMLDPLPDGPGIDYLPLAGTVKFNLLLFGVDFMPHEQVHFMPNVEMILYNETNAANPDADVIPRFTFYYTWK